MRQVGKLKTSAKTKRIHQWPFSRFAAHRPWGFRTDQHRPGDSPTLPLWIARRLRDCPVPSPPGFHRRDQSPPSSGRGWPPLPPERRSSTEGRSMWRSPWARPPRRRGHACTKASEVQAQVSGPPLKTDRLTPSFLLPSLLSLHTMPSNFVYYVCDLRRVRKSGLLVWSLLLRKWGSWQSWSTYVTLTARKKKSSENRTAVCETDFILLSFWQV